MLPSKEQKLAVNTDFKKVVLSALGRVIKMELDRLTVPPETVPVTVADKKLLDKLRYWMKTPTFADRNNPFLADQQYVTSILAMFDDTDTAEEDIVYSSEDEQGALFIDIDATKPIIMDRIMTGGYLYGLAGVIGEDFTTPPTE